MRNRQKRRGRAGAIAAVLPGLTGRAGTGPRRQPPLPDDRKPVLTPEEARRDHRTMLRFMALHALAGILIGIGFGVALILLDIGGLGTRISRAGNPILPFLLVLAPLASLFGGAAMASAIATLLYGSKYRQNAGNNRKS